MLSGQIIAGKYRLNQPIGAGGMASVWSATNSFTERQVAIKFMHPAVAGTPEAARRFLMEAKVSARVNHPNIIDILDVGQSEDGSFFLVMELLTGVSLETAMRRQSPPMLVHEFVGVMIDVGRALAAAHKNGVIHRDLKPTNIFLHMIRESVAVPKLLDFGVSKFQEAEQNNALTVAGTVLGSPLYMSPEQAMGSDGIDGRTDVFGFGAILFEALCGYRPYDAPNFNALIVMIATKQPKSIDEGAPNMPESVRAIVRDCLVTEREKRIASFDEVVDRLLDVLPELEASGLRLPYHKSAADPDATNALPMVRVSDRPPAISSPPGVHLSEPPGMASGASPPGAFSASFSDRYAATISRRPRAIMFGAGGVTAVLVAILFVVWLEKGTSPTQQGAEHTNTTGAVTGAVPPPATPASGEPRVINLDSIPVSSIRAATSPGAGKLSVLTTTGWCNLAIDGVGRGPTPVLGVEASAGPHQLVCTPPNGKTKTMTVEIVEGTASKFRMTLD